MIPFGRNSILQVLSFWSKTSRESISLLLETTCSLGEPTPPNLSRFISVNGLPTSASIDLHWTLSLYDTFTNILQR